MSSLFRKRLLGLALSLSVVAAAGVPAGGPVAASSLLDQIQDAKKQLQKIQDSISATKAKLTQTKQKAASVAEQLDELGQQLNETQAKLDELDAEIQAKEALLAQTEAELEAREAELSWREGLVNDRLVALYKAGHLSYLEVLLSSKSFSDLVERFTLLQRIAQNDAKLMYATQDARDAVAQKKAEVEAQRDELVQLHDRYASTKSTLNVQIAKQLELKEQLNRDAAAYQEALKQMEASSAKVQDLLLNLQSEYNRRNGIFALAYPLAGGRHYRISDPFGNRFHPILRVWRMHTGTDLAAPAGTTILAAESGRVVYAGWMSGYGNTTIIDHGVVNGHKMATLYGHQSKIYVHVGQVVQQNERIGAVGSTGLATGPHLHFEVRVDGTPVDPQKYVNLK